MRSKAAFLRRKNIAQHLLRDRIFSVLRHGPKLPMPRRLVSLRSGAAAAVSAILTAARAGQQSSSLRDAGAALILCSVLGRCIKRCWSRSDCASREAGVQAPCMGGAAFCDSMSGLHKAPTCRSDARLGRLHVNDFFSSLHAASGKVKWAHCRHCQTDGLLAPCDELIARRRGRVWAEWCGRVQVVWLSCGRGSRPDKHVHTSHVTWRNRELFDD